MIIQLGQMYDRHAAHEIESKYTDEQLEKSFKCMSPTYREFLRFLLSHKNFKDELSKRKLKVLNKMSEQK